MRRWERKDWRLAVLFLATGGLVTLYAFLAMRNGVPSILWAPGWLVGPLFVLLGGSALIKSLMTRSGPSDPAPPNPA